MTMKRKIFLIASLCVGLMLSAQTNVSAPMSFRIEKEVIPPSLEYVEGSVEFQDEDGNNVINAKENCHIKFKLANRGKGVGYACVVKIHGEGDTQGLTYNNHNLRNIAPNETINVDIPITASMATVNGKVSFRVQVDEPNKFGTEPISMTIDTRKFDYPFVEVVSYKITSLARSGILQKKRPFKLEIMLQNTDYGKAENVSVELSFPQDMFIQSGEKFQMFHTLAPNEKKTIEYEFTSNTSIMDSINLDITVKESFGNKSKNAIIPIKFGAATSGRTTNLEVASLEEKRVEISRGSLVADVDENIPQSSVNNEDTYVLIIANENYQNVSAVPFALNDGVIFKKYCSQALGVPDRNITYLANATANNIKAEVSRLSSIIKAKKGDAKAILYYAGHGVPDNSKVNGNAYLLPVDGIASDYTTGYKLDDLYATLGEYPAKSVMVFLDACFSGATRVENETVDPNARGVAVKVKKGSPVGDVVVFSAAQDDQKANPDMERKHGLFTYFLLKKLQESDGSATLEEITTYVTDKVGLESVILRHEQTPCVVSSPKVGSAWKSWKLK